ncbi:uncharacterized protein CLUP02_10468 [Colletotrichum lupini]|uniref:Uncharacterized protein n=1 Tax=Colletotrichum lupini TaxID=145971 RepID=A0A9Q8SWR2_9PEZI|nr:uncharacterized protein CLUP02_10468 [Colletotrichum lupini]UQC84972.1 hypothetical protein CLUP02_10468 [Colletotrichum lupini]
MRSTMHIQTAPLAILFVTRRGHDVAQSSKHISFRQPCSTSGSLSVAQCAYTPFLPSALTVVAATVGHLVCKKRNQTVWHTGTMFAATSVSVASTGHPLRSLTTTRYKTSALVQVTPWQATLARFTIDFPLDTGTSIQPFLIGATASSGSRLQLMSKSQLPSSSASLRFIRTCARSGHRYQNITSQFFDWAVSAVSTWVCMRDLDVLLRYPKSHDPASSLPWRGFVDLLDIDSSITSIKISCRPSPVFELVVQDSTAAQYRPNTPGPHLDATHLRCCRRVTGCYTHDPGVPPHRPWWPSTFRHFDKFRQLVVKISVHCSCSEVLCRRTSAACDELWPNRAFKVRPHFAVQSVHPDFLGENKTGMHCCLALLKDVSGTVARPESEAIAASSRLTMWLQLMGQTTCSPQPQDLKDPTLPWNPHFIISSICRRLRCADTWVGWHFTITRSFVHTSKIRSYWSVDDLPSLQSVTAHATISRVVTSKPKDPGAKIVAYKPPPYCIQQANAPRRMADGLEINSGATTMLSSSLHEWLSIREPVKLGGNSSSQPPPQAQAGRCATPHTGAWIIDAWLMVRSSDLEIGLPRNPHTHARAPSSRIFVRQTKCHEQYHSPFGSNGAKGIWSLTGESDCIGNNIEPQLSGDGSQTQEAAALFATKWSDSWGTTMVYRHIDSSHQHALGPPGKEIRVVGETGSPMLFPGLGNEIRPERARKTALCPAVEVTSTCATSRLRTYARPDLWQDASNKKRLMNHFTREWTVPLQCGKPFSTPEKRSNSPIDLVKPASQQIASTALGSDAKGRTKLGALYSQVDADVEIRFYGSNLRNRLLVLRVTLATRFVFSVPDPLDSATLHIIQTAGRSNSVSVSKPRTSFPQPRRLIVVTGNKSGVSRHTSHNVTDKFLAVALQWLAPLGIRPTTNLQFSHRAEYMPPVTTGTDPTGTAVMLIFRLPVSLADQKEKLPLFSLTTLGPSTEVRRRMITGTVHLSLGDLRHNWMAGDLHPVFGRRRTEETSYTRNTANNTSFYRFSKPIPPALPDLAIFAGDPFLSLLAALTRLLQALFLVAFSLNLNHLVASQTILVTNLPLLHHGRAVWERQNETNQEPSFFCKTLLNVSSTNTNSPHVEVLYHGPNSFYSFSLGSFASHSHSHARNAFTILTSVSPVVIHTLRHFAIQHPAVSEIAVSNAMVTAAVLRRVLDAGDLLPGDEVSCIRTKISGIATRPFPLNRNTTGLIGDEKLGSLLVNEDSRQLFMTLRFTARRLPAAWSQHKAEISEAEVIDRHASKAPCLIR